MAYRHRYDATASMSFLRDQSNRVGDVAVYTAVLAALALAWLPVRAARVAGAYPIIAFAPEPGKGAIRKSVRLRP